MEPVLDLQETNPKKKYISKALACLLAAIAIYGLYILWIPFITRHDFKLSSIFFLFIFPIPYTLVMIYFFNTARHLWKGPSSKALLKLAISGAIIFAISVFSVIIRLFPAFPLINESPLEMFDVPLAMMTAGGFYLCLKNSLHKWFTVNMEFNYPAHKQATKHYFGFLAFFLWTAISQTSDLLPRDSRYNHMAENHTLETLIMFGSIPLAYLFYRVGLKIFLKKSNTDDNEILSHYHKLAGKN